MEAKERTIHMVGHGHIDPTWLWRWTEGYQEVRATFRSALERMAETPEFRFSASSACFYDWVRRSEPKLFAAIQEAVARGQWELAGGMWVEPDCNLPDGECLVRQGLYAQRFFKEHFGQYATVGFNPDSFGHAGTLPQILKKLGMDCYVFLRPQAGVERDYPGGATFVWEGPSGDQVLACNIAETYNWGDDIRARIERLCADPHLLPEQRHLLGFYGVGNHGGGPTRAAIAGIAEMAGEDGAPEARFSTVRAYFDAIRASHPGLPVVHGELQHHARGCYSAHSGIKRLIRKTEHALMTAERYAAAAWLLGVYEFPRETFTAAWKHLLYNQFHDIIAGTSIPAAYDDARDQVGAARHAAHAIINEAAQIIARDVNTSAEGNAIIVFNPMTWPVVQPVEVNECIEAGIDGPLGLVNDEGATVAHQAVRGDRPGARAYAFVAEVPAMGYRTYYARGGTRRHSPKQSLESGNFYLQNDWWRIEYDPADAAITRLRDRRHGLELLERGIVLSCLVDGSDTWSHGVDEYRTEAGRFGNAELHVHEHGDVLATIRATSRFRDSEAIQELTLYRDIELIDLRLHVNWQEAHHVLKLMFNTRIQEGAATYETPYGAQERPATGEEEPTQQWVDLTGEVDGLPYGFAILNDGTYAADVKAGLMRVTLLRSPAYAHHDPARYEAGTGHEIMDQGWHSFHFRLVPHAGDWRDSRVVKQAWELNHPEVVHVESAHPGIRPQQATLLGTEADNVLITVLKQAEDGNDFIIRGYEISGRAASTTLHLPYFKQRFHLEFAPYEIKTLRVNPETWEVREVNLLEEETAADDA